MTTEAQDQILERLLQSSFCMDRTQEDEFWTRFEARRRLETLAWAAFSTRMAFLGARLRLATRPS